MNELKLHLTDYTLSVPFFQGEPNINNNSKGKDDTRLGVHSRAQKAFFLEMERKK